MTETPAPRHELIDALRGFALAGVLLVNLLSLTLFEFMPEAVGRALPSARFDAAALEVIEWLANVKAITVFSLLFGLGFAIQLERAQAHGDVALRRFRRRLFWLAGIGAVHGFLIWWGDILLTYAVCGLLLLLFRRASNRTLLIAALLLAIVLPPLIFPWMREQLAWLPRQKAIHAASWEACGSQSFIAALTQNIAMASWARVSNWALVGFVLGRFLLGYWAGRLGLFQQPQQHLPLIRRLFWSGLVLGLATTLLQFESESVTAAMPMFEQGTPRMVLRMLMRLGPLALGISYAAGFTLLYRRPAIGRRLRVLAPMGRMALTHYLSQSLIGIGLFYGFAAGIGPRFGIAGVLLAWIAIFGAQLALSRWWLARFLQGPAEWLWRSLTDGEWQPFKRKAPLPAGSGA